MATKRKPDLESLYRELGYRGPRAPKTRTRGGTPRDFPGAEDLPPLDHEGLARLEKMLSRDGKAFLAEFREAHQLPVSNDELRQAFGETREAFTDPDAYVKKRRAARSQERPPRPRGARADFPPEIQLYNDIVIDPQSHKFEPRADMVGWIVNAGYQFILRERLKLMNDKGKFGWHTSDNPFIYDLKNRTGQPEQKISMALFSDFGTGLYHSRFIARHMAALQPDYAIHLGDVYYAGRSTEFEKNFNEPLSPVFAASRFLALNANHEMLSGGKPFFNFLAQRQSRQRPELQQEGSYFCLRHARYQIIGIDTAFHEIGRHHKAELNGWLRQRLEEGKKSSPPLCNILLSQNEPYDLGEKNFTPLYRDLKKIIDNRLIDFWFWGNAHYGALYAKNEAAPFVGSCIGHGGHPIYRQQIIDNRAKHAELVRKGSAIPPALWVEDGPKFPDHIPGRPEWKNPRPDLGNHGFCLMELENGKIKLTYYDWLQKVRHVAEYPA